MTKACLESIYDMVDVSAFLVTACVLPFNTRAQRCPSSGLQIDNSVKLDKWHGPDNNENEVPSCYKMRSLLF